MHSGSATSNPPIGEILCLSHEAILRLYQEELTKQFPPKKQNVSRILVVLTLAAWVVNVVLFPINGDQKEKALKAAINTAYAQLDKERDRHKETVAGFGDLMQQRENNRHQIAEKQKTVDEMKTAVEALRGELAKLKQDKADKASLITNYVRVVLQGRAQGVTEVMNAALSPTMETRREVLNTLEKEMADWAQREYAPESVALSGNKLQVIYRYSFAGAAGEAEGYARETWTLNAAGCITHWNREMFSECPEHTPGYKKIN